MDWHLNCLLIMALVPLVYSWSPIASSNNQRRSFYYPPAQPAPEQQQARQRNAISPYLDLVLCPLREQPWSCARQQSGRLLDIWDGELHTQWQKLKAEADRQLNSTLERRGYSESLTLSKEKPSTILKKIEIGTNYMKEYLAETMDGFLGREYDYQQNTETEDDDEDDEEEEEEEQVAQIGNVKNSNTLKDNANNLVNGNDSDNEFIEVAEEDEKNNEDVSEDHNEEDTNDEEALEELKKPGGGKRKNKNKNKNKKKGQQLATQAANLLVIQPLDTHHDDGGFDDHGSSQLLKPTLQKVKPFKQKKRKKNKGQGATVEYVVEQQPSSDHLGLGLLEELADWGDADVGGKRKKKMKYGRSNGVTRGKKKKKKKALMKLMLLGSFLKAKIELLLKLLGAHLQIKFFAIALIGLLINIARFWIDVKRGGTPTKVVYVEHAHHQHHYEDHGDDWSESAGGGGYWKRSLQTDSTENTYESATDSYQPSKLQYGQSQQQQSQQYDPQYMAYRNQWQRK